jgi:DNA-binding response OmpR family regulator
VDVHVQQLRDKLAKGGVGDPAITTVWGVGYKLDLGEV